MAITLKQAIELNPMALLSAEEQKKKEIEKEVEYFTKIIDEFIAVNIHTIMQRPIASYNIDMPYKAEKQIIELYKDFTIRFSFTNRCMTIKLANKDWDWPGYGIKPVEEKVKEPKKKGFFNKLFR